MQVRITDVVPVQPRFRPDIGEVYEVIATHWTKISSTIRVEFYHIAVNGKVICVGEHHCKVLGK